MNNNDDWVEDVNFTPFKFYEFVEQVWAKARKFRYSYEKTCLFELICGR